MKVCLAPGNKNSLCLSDGLQVRVDLRREDPSKGKVRLRAYASKACDGSTSFDESQNISEAHALVTDKEKDLKFAVLIFSGIPQGAYLRLDVDTPNVAGEQVFKGQTLAELKEAWG